MSNKYVEFNGWRLFDQQDRPSWWHRCPKDTEWTTYSYDNGTTERKTTGKRFYCAQKISRYGYTKWWDNKPPTCEKCSTIMSPKLKLLFVLEKKGVEGRTTRKEAKHTRLQMSISNQIARIEAWAFWKEQHNGVGRLRQVREETSESLEV